mmetsp:Transcript_19020/g.48691  ORF Transcript_19020/g.48691 Transcript_19020/m.48691 type:complete len:405 (+) Transcript_19020:17-1231(+)
MSSLGAVLLLCIVDAALGCSTVHVTSPTGETVIGRTMELGGAGGEMHANYRGMLVRMQSGVPSLPWEVAAHRRGETVGEGMQVLCGSQTSGAWSVKYGYVSVDLAIPESNITSLASDGINEMGLTVSEHTLRQSQYMAPNMSVPSNSQLQVCWVAITTWLLGNIDSVATFRSMLSELRILAPSVPVPDGDLLHWSIDDKNGEHIVIEVLDGQIQVHDNTVGTFTNDPDFRWHLRNLNNYVNLRSDWPNGGDGIQVQTEVGAVPQVVGHGFNLLGLPGDFSPPGRFVRLFYQRSYAMLKYPPASLNGSIALVSGLLNSVMISHGTLSDAPGTAAQPEFTQYTVIKLSSSRHFYYKDYVNTQWRLVRLSELDFSPRSRTVTAVQSAIPLVDGTLGVEDMTGAFAAV